MAITKVQFKPGIRREGTSFAEEGHWYDCDKIRFRNGRPEKIGGWTTYTAATFKGVVRVMHNWSLLDGKDCLALGTSKKFYIEYSGTIYDITPIVYSATGGTNPITSGAAGTATHTLTTPGAHNASVGDTLQLSGVTGDCDGIVVDTYNNPFTTKTAGSKLVLVNTTNPHYAAVGDSVVISGATGFDGIPTGDFNTTHAIVEVASATTYCISVATGCTAGNVTGGGTPVTAKYQARLNRSFTIVAVPSGTTLTFTTDKVCTTGGVAFGGAAVSIQIELESGFTLNAFGGGWGTSYWARGPWGGSISSTVSGISLRIWSVDNYGEDLIFCRRDGQMFYWDATNGLDTNAVLVSSLPGANAVPTQTSIVRVTEDRHVLAIGATNRLSALFDPLLIRWSNQEDFLEWEPSATNTSGAIRIPLGSYVMAAIHARQEILVWTDRSLHSLQFIGPPYIFGIQTLAESTSIAGPNAAINANNVTYWMGTNKFWMYSGRVETMPCDVQRYVFDNINFGQLAQTYAAANPQFAEITWFYCDSTSSQVNRYVTYNYEQNIWTIGSMARTAMQFCQGRNGLPYAAGGGYDSDNGKLYKHEVGYDDGSTNPPTAIESYIESADFSVADGDKLIFADRIIPDITFARSTVDDPTVDVTVEAKKFPGQSIQSSDARTVSKSITGTVDQFTTQMWARLRGREMRIKIASTGIGVCWLLGTIRINIRQDGRQ